MQERIVLAAEEIAIFCRLQMYAKKDLPIRSSEMGILIFIQKQIDNVTPLMISDFFQITKPSVTVILNELVKQKFLKKSPSPTDGRSYNVYITNKGKELVLSAQKEYFKSIAVLEDKMKENNFNKFIELLKTANSILKEERT